MSEKAEKDARRYRAALREIAAFPDHEDWLTIARKFADNVIDGMGIAEAKRDAIAEMDRDRGYAGRA